MEQNVIDSFERWVESEEGKKEGAKNGKNGYHQVMLRAVAPDVEFLISKGYSAKLIWKFLSRKNKISCNYDTFLTFLRKRKQSSKVTTLAIPEKQDPVVSAKPQTNPLATPQLEKPISPLPATDLKTIPIPAGHKDLREDYPGWPETDWRGEKYDPKANKGKIPPPGYSAHSTYFGQNNFDEEIWHDTCPDPKRLLRVTPSKRE